MDLVKKNAPTLFVALIVLGLYIATNNGWLTADQVSELKSLLLVMGVPAAHYMPSPAKKLATKIGTVALLAMLLPACRSFGHASNPIVEGLIDGVCGLMGAQKDAFVAEESKKLGVSPEVILKGIKVACDMRPGAATREDVEREATVIASHP